MSGGPAIMFAESRDAGTVARLGPRARLAATLLFAIVLAHLREPAVLALALAMGAITALWARPPLHATLRRLLAVEGFLLLLLVTLPFTVAGTESFRLAGLSASWQGLDRAFAIFMRVNAAMLVVSGLLSTLGTMRLAQAMTGIGIPAKMAQLLLLTVRYIGVFQEEHARLRRAMRARAFRPGSNRHSWRAVGNLIGMLLVRSVERAQRVAWAMKSRGYAGRFPALGHDAGGAADIVFLAAWSAALAGLVALEIAG